MQSSTGVAAALRAGSQAEIRMVSRLMPAASPSAGGEISASLEDLTNENVATISQFSDVDPHAYYAKAVAWCVEMGVANGYGDTFGCARSISTEEFVTMLAR